MYDLKIDTDFILSGFINDHVERRLSSSENTLFEEYMATDKKLSSFVYKSKQAKKALKEAYTVRAADDFEEKLARRIANETLLANSLH